MDTRLFIRATLKPFISPEVTSDSWRFIWRFGSRFGSIVVDEKISKISGEINLVDLGGSGGIGEDGFDEDGVVGLDGVDQQLYIGRHYLQ